MDDDGAVIQQLPAVAPVALSAQHGLAQLLQGVLSVVTQGLNMGIGGTGADQEVICQAAHPVDLQQLDIHTLLGIQSFGYLIGDLFRC